MYLLGQYLGIIYVLEIFPDGHDLRPQSSNHPRVWRNFDSVVDFVHTCRKHHYFVLGSGLFEGIVDTLDVLVWMRCIILHTKVEHADYAALVSISVLWLFFSWNLPSYSKLPFFFGGSRFPITRPPSSYLSS